MNLFTSSAKFVILCWLVTLAHSIVIKCRHGNDAYTLSCRFSYLNDNKTLKADVPVDFQNHTKDITQLTIDISNLTTIPSDTFTMLPNLHTLVARADCKTLTKRQFINATKLIVLNFGYNNQLAMLEARLFKYAQQLEYIDMAYNLIETVESDAFQGLKKLKKLYLDGNGISFIENGTLAGLYSVELLDLSRNNIGDIESGAFLHLGKLKRLQLNRNRLRRLPSSIFSGLRSIERIDLSLNMIEEIDDDVFENLPTLVILDLGFNRLQSLADSLFDGASNLNSLFLASNGIFDIDMLFQNLTELKQLDLSYNQIEYIDSSALSNITRLESLEIRGCNLAELDENLFSEHTQLISLDLSENNLTTIDLNIFGPLENLRFLKLEANHLKELSNATQMKSILPSLEFINLSRNQINCDSVLEMIEYFESNKIDYEFGPEVDVVCGLLPFESQALQAYQLSNAQFLSKDQLHTKSK